jgi:hypothetical protein
MILFLFYILMHETICFVGFQKGCHLCSYLLVPEIFEKKNLN